MKTIKKNITAVVVCTLLAAAGVATIFATELTEIIEKSEAGAKIGTTATQKVGFFGATPVVQPASTNTTRQAMVGLGLLATGGSDPTDFVPAATDSTLGDGVDIGFGTTNGTKFGTATAQKLAFHNATPVIQRASSNQAAVATNALTANATTYDGTEAAAVATRAEALTVLVNELRAALVEKGLIKGSN